MIIEVRSVKELSQFESIRELKHRLALTRNQELKPGLNDIPQGSTSLGRPSRLHKHFKKMESTIPRESEKEKRTSYININWSKYTYLDLGRSWHKNVTKLSIFSSSKRNSTARSPLYHHIINRYAKKNVKHVLHTFSYLIYQKQALTNMKACWDETFTDSHF